MFFFKRTHRKPSLQKMGHGRFSKVDKWVSSSHARKGFKWVFMRLLLFQSLEMTTLKVNELFSSTPVSYYKKIASTRVMLKYLILCTNIINSYGNSYIFWYLYVHLYTQRYTVKLDHNIPPNITDIVSCLTHD